MPSLFFKLSSLLLNIRPFKFTAEHELYQNPVPSFAAQLSSSIDSQNSFSSSSNFIFPFAPNDLGLKMTVCEFHNDFIKVRPAIIIIIDIRC